jgi:hypothetical protein
MVSSKPVIKSIKRRNGVAGQISYVAEVQYLGEKPETVEFIGSVYGGPVVMAWASTVAPRGRVEVFVSDPGQHGKFSPEWVRRFYAERA